jgi:hypothetical protein
MPIPIIIQVSLFDVHVKASKHRKPHVTWTSQALPKPHLLACRSNHSCAISAHIFIKSNLSIIQMTQCRSISRIHLKLHSHLHEHSRFYQIIHTLAQSLSKRLPRKEIITCNVPPPPVVSQSSDTLTNVQGSDAFQWKSTTLSLNEQNEANLWDFSGHRKYKRISKKNGAFKYWRCALLSIKHIK